MHNFERNELKLLIKKGLDYEGDSFLKRRITILTVEFAGHDEAPPAIPVEVCVSQFAALAIIIEMIKFKIINMSIIILYKINS